MKRRVSDGKITQIHLLLDDSKVIGSTVYTGALGSTKNTRPNVIRRGKSGSVKKITISHIG